MCVKYGFVILNYMTKTETEKCVESIDRYVEEQHHIIIVDNASPDGSGEELSAAYENRSDVTVIINEHNLGFACGNNVGIRKATAEQCDYVIVLNSDTMLMQKEFCTIINAKYEEFHYAVIGPKIYKHGVESRDNPGRDKPMSRSKLLAFIAMNRILLMLSHVGLDEVLNNMFNAYVENKKADTIQNTEVEKVALHGCCLIFTPAFFKKFDGFDGRTYMYMEEDVLYHHLLKAGLISAYVPGLHIEHLEETATNKVYTGVIKRRFKYKNYIRSSKVMLAIDRERT